MLEQVAETVRERGELRRLVASLTAQGRMSRWIVTALPICCCSLVSALNPTYMEPLFETTAAGWRSRSPGAAAGAGRS